MSILDKFLSALGFESSEEQKVTQKPKKKKNMEIASFNLTSNTHNKRLPATRNISNQEQVIQVLEELKKKSAIIIDITGFDKVNRIRAFDFISGAVFALEGTIKKIDSNKYLCSLDDITSFLGDEW